MLSTYRLVVDSGRKHREMDQAQLLTDDHSLALLQTVANQVYDGNLPTYIVCFVYIQHKDTICTICCIKPSSSILKIKDLPTHLEKARLAEKTTHDISLRCCRV